MVDFDISGEQRLVLDEGLNFHGVHHVGLLCANLETSLEFYKDTIGKGNVYRWNESMIMF